MPPLCLSWTKADANGTRFSLSTKSHTLHFFVQCMGLFGIIKAESGAVSMMTRERAENRAQMEIISLEDMVPENHLVRKLEAAIDWNFIYDLVEPLYCEDNGRPSLDPVTLIKLPVLQYMFGIRSMRQTVAEAEVNTAYRWFLGLGLQDKVPHFSTFSKNYTRRFKDTDLFEQIFQRHKIPIDIFLQFRVIYL